ncbi:MAG: GIY-YIG nuclease family protein [Parvibaculaceae bacterium]|nr:GIY-YIG nuclease family protein [Parvibaculaceae bacterium]
MKREEPSAPLSKPWYLYILECAGGRLYTGITVDVEARYRAHVEGTGAKFTRSFPPERILMVAVYAGRSQASKAEHEIKKLSPAEKRRLAGV